MRYWLAFFQILLFLLCGQLLLNQLLPHTLFIPFLFSSALFSAAFLQSYDRIHIWRLFLFLLGLSYAWELSSFFLPGVFFLILLLSSFAEIGIALLFFSKKTFLSILSLTSLIACVTWVALFFLFSSAHGVWEGIFVPWATTTLVVFFWLLVPPNAFPKRQLDILLHSPVSS